MTNRFRFHTKDNTSMVYDTENEVYYYCIDLNDICDLLNALHKENEQLKQFQTNVFTLISEMIETANLYRTPIKTLDYGDDLGYWNGVYQKLKELRDILENEQTRK